MEVFTFQAVLVPYAPGVEWPAETVLRTIAVREDHTLEQLHEALRLAFGWADPHMYAVRPLRTPSSSGSSSSGVW